VADLLGRGVHPITVTGIAWLVGIGAAAAAAGGRYHLALAAWLANRVLDGLDGVLARRTGRQSDLGGYLDLVLDFTIYALLPAAIVMSRPSLSTALAALALLASFYVNAAGWMYLSAVLERRDRGAESHGEQTVVTMPDGIVTGTETIVFYSLFLLFPGNAAPLFLVMAALVMATALQRIVWAWRVL
jgi:phosphatidylglycerophosphate synthase